MKGKKMFNENSLIIPFPGGGHGGNNVRSLVHTSKPSPIALSMGFPSLYSVQTTSTGFSIISEAVAIL